MCNKFVLKVKLIKESSIRIEFIHWDNRFLSEPVEKDNPKFAYFESADLEFCFYSHDEGYVLDYDQFALVVPDSENMKSGYTIEHTFKNDEVRYNFLKRLYKYLQEWYLYWESFRNDQLPRHKMTVHDEYWFW
ncbi:MAG: hypothetical protein ACOC3V_04145 [bacterium]